MTVTSNYGVLAFGTVAVTDVTPTPHVVLATCSFSSSATCNVSGLIAGHTLSVTPAPAAGFVVTGGTGKCAGLSPTNVIQFTVPTSGSVQCGVAGGYPLTVTANNAGVVAALIASIGSQCSLPGTAGQSCQLAVAPGPLSLTIGLAANTALVSDTGLCTNAAPTA
ncbi:MAG TPA: hypothetical protein VH184_10490, partial [Dongiaceae bacterium]|nr:hypothetical protein [Dongiaceae bacterium]